MRWKQREHAVCFTGHRDFPCRESGRIVFAIEKLIAQGYTDFYTGGAKGFDSRAAQAVLYLKQYHPQIKLHLLLPCIKDVQTRGWLSEELELYDYLRQNATSCTVLPQLSGTGKNKGKRMMQQRNQALVDAASYCVCWYLQDRPHTGTAQTIRMAQAARVEILNLADERQILELCKK